MMANKVNQFLNESGGNNFTETAPRPPVPGEENELQSNGGMSSRSSGSHKSHVSHVSARSIGSNKGDVNPATPRKSNLDKTLCSVSGAGCDLDPEAPLGFEPEGSAANSPPFTENSTPPYLKWAENLKYLLGDCDGVQLFANFLKQEGIGSNSVEFWFACEGLKKKKADQKEVGSVIRAIYKKYIKSDKLPCISVDTKRDITERLRVSSDQEVFDAAQQEVETDMRNNTYPLFLKSDLYVQYVSKGGESPKSSNSSSGSNSARPTSGLLPTLQEDEELQTSDLSSSFYIEGPPPAKSSSKAHFDPKKPEMYSGSYSGTFRPTPYHTSYAPVSAQDSEIQSLSSQDAMTDDTRSLTDSSVDGFSHRGDHTRKRSKHQRVKKQWAAHNREDSLFIPRTERAPKDRNIAETDPQRFAAELTEKLKKVLAEREKNERLHMSLSQMNAPEPAEPVNETLMSTTSASTSLSHGHGNTNTLVPLLTSSMIDEENADSILEEHCSRIWESSNQQTPNRSPGRHSPPKPKSPDRSRKGHSQTQSHTGPSSMPGTLHNKSLHSRKRTEFCSQLSFDSGVCEEKPHETHKHIHHHYHHLAREKKYKHKLEMEAQHHTMMCWSETPRMHSSGGPIRKTTIRNLSDASSNIDSGISLIESIPPQVPNVTDPSTSKVLQWMMDNDNVNCGGNSTYTDSDKSSSHKRSHKSSGVLGTSQQQPYKQSVSKKSNRSASADSGRRLPWVPSLGAMPSQPFVQDPQMPLMTAPNTTTQLEEVNRRLEADNSKSAPVKSKSFAGVPSKDKRFAVPMSQSCQSRSGMSTTRTVPADLDLTAGGEINTSQTTEKKKRSSGSGNTSTSSKTEETVVGYYLCGEPIPYRTTIPQPSVTLGQLKHHISKRGNYRYFFKTVNKDFDSDVVWEEIKEDTVVIPVYEGKVVCKIERIE